MITPLHREVAAAHNLPVLDRIGVTRALVLSSFAIALLAGFGLQRLIDGGAAERRRILTVASVAGAVPVVLLVVGLGSLGALPDGLRHLAGADAAPTGAAVADAAVLRWLLLAAASVTVVALLLRAGRRAAGPAQ